MATLRSQSSLVLYVAIQVDFVVCRNCIDTYWANLALQKFTKNNQCVLLVICVKILYTIGVE